MPSINVSDKDYERFRSLQQRLSAEKNQIIPIRNVVSRVLDDFVSRLESEN
jgi:hypothetical protein